MHYTRLKRALLGRPLASFQEQRERLGKPTGLAVLASDAISSTAYAAEEILRVLVPVAAAAAFNDLVPIAVVVCLMLVIVVASYRQTIHAYPSGGGAYIVSRENLGTTPSLVAGASLLVDYVLTAAVSVSAGVAAITSAYPGLYALRVELCVAFVGLIALGNLRGIRESGRLFASPTYVYVVGLGLLISVGVIRSLTGEIVASAATAAPASGVGVVGLVTPFLLMRAFSSGAVALTGVEAISNGVPAFHPPEAKNAASTLVVMGLILGVGFFGTAWLAFRLQPALSDSETLLSSIALVVFGGRSIPYFVMQFSTFAILILAANTAFADFPRLSSIIALDGFLPRQMARRGDRLVFSNGILILAGFAVLLLVVFRGDTTALIPLYAVGVFTGFTLSQVGMVRHHQRLRETQWRRNMVVNGVGAAATGVVLVVVLVSKFTIGAWIPAVLIPLVVVLFRRISLHYRRAAEDRSVPAGYRPQSRQHTVVLLVGSVDRPTIDALAYALLLHGDRFHAVHIGVDSKLIEPMRAAWDRLRPGIPLEVVPSVYRDLTGPMINYLEHLSSSHPDDMLSVVIPEYVEAHWWDNALHNQSARALTTLLREWPNTAVIGVPSHARTIRGAKGGRA